MRMSIYYTNEDQYLMDKAEQEAEQEADTHHKSKNAVILTALEYYFARDRLLGEILRDMGRLEPKQLEAALKKQEKQDGRPLGEILLAEGMVRSQDLNRALNIQNRSSETR